MSTVLSVQELTGEFPDVLREYYIESEFIDPVDEIMEKLKKTESVSQAFGVYRESDLVSFFIIDNSSPDLEFNRKLEGSYWLESFFITRKFTGKGFAKNVVLEIIQTMETLFPDMTSLNLTVNFRNHIAKKIYQNCGFTDTGKIYAGGPAGPQHIYSTKII